MLRTGEAASGIAQKRIEGGWQIADFQLFKYRLSYQSNFGDPADGQKPTDWIVASFKLTRLPWVLFFRLMSGAYVSVAFLITLRSRKFNDNGETIRRRVGRKGSPSSCWQFLSWRTLFALGGSSNRIRHPAWRRLWRWDSRRMRLGVGGARLPKDPRILSGLSTCRCH
jgi:hypothetical protein